MSEFFGMRLTERRAVGCPKRWDFVSEDSLIVGDAKFLALVDRSRFPPAKMMEIAGHVWLLETLKNARPFLVFGNQIEVPRVWLNKYGALSQKVEFYFLAPDGELTDLRKTI
jgi:hypothetical protein